MSICLHERGVASTSGLNFRVSVNLPSRLLFWRNKPDLVLLTPPSFGAFFYFPKRSCTLARERKVAGSNRPEARQPEGSRRHGAERSGGSEPANRAHGLWQPPRRDLSSSDWEVEPAAGAWSNRYWDYSQKASDNPGMTGQGLLSCWPSDSGVQVYRWTGGRSSQQLQ